MDPGFEARLGRLEDALGALDELLAAHGETHWREWFRRCRVRLDNRDPRAFEEVLGAFGGMGSVNDLVLVGAEGGRPSEGSSDPGLEADRALRRLAEVVWVEAKALRAALAAD